MPPRKIPKVSFVEAIKQEHEWITRKGITIPITADPEIVDDAIQWAETNCPECKQVYFNAKEKAWVAIV
ncbi:hypothetical protein F9B85_00905 [Heliorestis acidaminivorans]|uniref:Uncharacterized protein n=1 Tax=Heliorestis acidaminivorans TaxID=553427 RepID=A0A6I0EU22_9FIRM|nr:hypothetical protein [Heliorestis acidaminivorans]KAB2954285.1 hypothetical protein F9B85_00905 [Heliorestis acidaminivorans]